MTARPSSPARIAVFDSGVGGLTVVGAVHAALPWLDIRFLGDTGTYFFLYVVGERVPPHEEWMKAHASTAHRASASRSARKAR